jgi:methylamine--corrinoid protein Co-methyltransferase
MDTQRMIKVTEDEICDGLKAAPRKLVFGEGRDSSFCEPVKVGQDGTPLVIQGGPTGAPVSEDVFVQVHQSYAQEAMVDTIVNGCLYTVEGHEATPDSPWELKAARTEQRYIKLATARANRPYMGI